jgi:hypothetical protein
VADPYVLIVGGDLDGFVGIVDTADPDTIAYLVASGRMADLFRFFPGAQISAAREGPFAPDVRPLSIEIPNLARAPKDLLPLETEVRAGPPRVAHGPLDGPGTPMAGYASVGYGTGQLVTSIGAPSSAVRRTPRMRQVADHPHTRRRSRDTRVPSATGWRVRKRDTS